MAAVSRLHPLMLAGGLLLACLVVAGMSFYPIPVLFGVLAAIAFAVIIARPTFGIYVLSTLFLIDSTPMYQAYGTLAHGASAADGVGAGVVLGCLLHIGRRSMELSRPAQAVLLAASGYFLWGIVTLAWSPASFAMNYQFARLSVEAVALLALCLLLLQTREQVVRAAAIYAVVGFILSLYTIATFRANGGFTVSQFSPLAALSYRGGVQGYNPNDLALLVSLVPGFAYLGTASVARGLRLVLLTVTIAVVGAALLILGSREILLAILPSLAVGVVMMRGSGRRMVSALFIVVLGVGALYVVSNALLPWWVASRFSQGDLGSVGGRLPLWILGLHLFAANPVAGVGANGLEMAILQGHVAAYLGQAAVHNEYVRTLADAGLVGFVLFVIMLAAIGYTLVRGQRNVAAIAIYAMVLITFMANNNASSHGTWAVFSILCCYGLSTSRSGEMAEVSEVPHEALGGARDPELSGRVAERGRIIPFVPTSTIAPQL